MTYLLIITNLHCNHRCSYCIQQESSLDVRMTPDKVDVDLLLKFLSKNRIAHSAKVMGGEATLHPDFERLMDGLLEIYPKVVLTTNVNGKWFRNFPKTLETMKGWGRRVVWNTTYHPAWMDVDVYIDRIRAMRAAGLKLDQVAATDTPELSQETAEKLHGADIGWKLHPSRPRTSATRSSELPRRTSTAPPRACISATSLGWQRNWRATHRISAVSRSSTIELSGSRSMRQKPTSWQR